MKSSSLSRSGGASFREQETHKFDKTLTSSFVATFNWKEIPKLIICFSPFSLDLRGAHILISLNFFRSHVALAKEEIFFPALETEGEAQ